MSLAVSQHWEKSYPLIWPMLFMLLSLLPEGRGLNSVYARWVWSFIMQEALFLHLEV